MASIPRNLLLSLWPSVRELRELVSRFHDSGVRVSVFVDPIPAPIEWAAELGADRVELYTEPYARAFEQGGEALQSSLEMYRVAAEHASACGLGVNAGHDLDLENLPTFLTVPHVQEVSIGHALMARAMFVGLHTVVREYVEMTTSR